MVMTEQSFEESLFFGQLVAQVSPLELLKQVLMHSHHAIVITEACAQSGYRIVYANEVFCRHTGYELAELVGLSPKILQGPQSNHQIIARITPELSEKGYFYGASINYRKDGTVYPVEWNISEIRDAQGRVTHYISMQKDLSTLKALVEQIKQSNDVFKAYFINHCPKQTAMREQQAALDHIKRNEKLYAASLRDDERYELFEHAFFDFSPGEQGALCEQRQKNQVSASQFLQDSPVETDDVAALIEGIRDTDAELGYVESIELTLDRLQSIARCYKDLANNLYYYVDFNDGALMLDEIAMRLAEVTSTEDFPVPLLLSVNQELAAWLNSVFVEQNASDIFDGERQLIASGKQLLMFI